MHLGLQSSIRRRSHHERPQYHQDDAQGQEEPDCPGISHETRDLVFHQFSSFDIILGHARSLTRPDTIIRLTADQSI